MVLNGVEHKWLKEREAVARDSLPCLMLIAAGRQMAQLMAFYFTSCLMNPFSKDETCNES